MSKFHINKHGVPASCKASKGNCPLGGISGDENHFNTQEEAQIAADKINAATSGLLPGMNINEMKEKANDKVYDEIYNLLYETKEGEEMLQAEPNTFISDNHKDLKEEVKKYFDTIIENYEKGISPEETNKTYKHHNWREDLGNDMDGYLSAEALFGDSSGDKSGAEEDFETDAENCEETDWAYKENIDLIHNVIIKKVKDTDWTELYDTQIEGEIAALKHIRDNDLLPDY